MLRFISAINSLNTPWVAMVVIVLGMVFDIVCQKYGVSNDAATGVIGAGIGLLTGQALHAAQVTTTNPAQTSTKVVVDPSTGTAPIKAEKEL